MATVILTAVGTVFGGPIGGAIGALAGSFVDNQVLGSGSGREGPRLTELDVQTSSYGTSVSAVFGQMRVAGTVIWATDLRETRNREGGGKGRPSTTTFSYSVSMAVALSSRPLARVGRIWADGNLIRGAADDFKVQTEFRFYDGHGDQPIDPLIASDVGLDRCPAHRGLAYVVFEDLQLADFGNRIPQMTFEVIEREEDVAIHHIMSETSNAIIGGEVSASLRGYAVEGGDIRSALQPILRVCPVSVFPEDAQLRLTEWPAAAQASNPVAAFRHNGREIDQPKTSFQRANDLPKSITLRYYEPARDYQLGIQQSDRAGAGYNLERYDLPAAITAASAKEFADAKLLDLQHSRSSLEGSFVSHEEKLRPGSWISVADGQDLFRLNEAEHFKGYSIYRARGSLSQLVAAAPSFATGLHVPSADYQIGETRLVAMDLPNLTSVAADAPVVAIAAAGTKAGWRGANLSVQQGANLIDIGSTANPASIGSLSSALSSHTALLIDEHSQIEIELLHDRMQVPASYGDPTVSSAPAVWIDGEIVRFGYAEPIGNSNYRLSRLMRGSFGTENKIGDHAAGAACLFLDETTLKPINAELAIPGTQLTIEAMGMADEQPVMSELSIYGAAIRPRAPVHGRLSINGDGDRQLSWIRIPRSNSGWQDFIDQPLDEETEAYDIVIGQGGQAVFEAELASPALSFSASEWLALGLDSSLETAVRIRQLGKYGVSEALVFSV